MFADFGRAGTKEGSRLNDHVTTRLWSVISNAVAGVIGALDSLGMVGLIGLLFVFIRGRRSASPTRFAVRNEEESIFSQGLSVSTRYLSRTRTRSFVAVAQFGPLCCGDRYTTSRHQHH